MFTRKSLKVLDDLLTIGCVVREVFDTVFFYPDGHSAQASRSVFLIAESRLGVVEFPFREEQVLQQCSLAFSEVALNLRVQVNVDELSECSECREVNHL